MVTIAQVIYPSQRAESIGIFRLWRDSGYAFGAIISGMLADYLGITMAILKIGLLTLLASLLLRFRMPDDKLTCVFLP
jgi:predicted MFS family arabinose efflux permease